MKFCFATNQEIENWNNLIIHNPDDGNIFQTKEFAEIKSGNRWKPRFVKCDKLYFMLLERKILPLGKLWYIPKGPGINNIDEIKKLLPELKNFAKENGVFVVKLEPELLKTDEIVKKITKIGLKNNRGIQAANTIILDISGTIEQIQAKFSQQTRNKVRLAIKDNVSTRLVPINDKNCKIFYDMMVKTINGRSPLRGYSYFENFWKLHDKAGTGVFMFAYDNKQVVATDFITILGYKAYRKDAATSHDSPVRGASSLLEITAINYLKERGVTKYDLYGSPPSDQIKNPKHPFYGFGTFKAGFNSEVTDYIGCLDLIVKPTAYKIWEKGGERITKKAYRTIYHELFY